MLLYVIFFKEMKVSLVCLHVCTHENPWANVLKSDLDVVLLVGFHASTF
jgi:hypothetical protein